ncbi:NFU1 iron-sulfur cluster scaffold-like protein, mitochondrial [Geosmithia morbida]|uniref:NFU1 iron-sulfur cluster scaffold-like protein, mitochondrial n=1 Tax=Geosmithia morbida TaxID=1094350 RepID=A0A9P5D293_9HYPO|nr:NFU1 iron-sulfur cluster scaffold-like protein, mitochondrial [Geosmithia morbida]KAF4123617.1 NFU1 iron-sulfur cluster scaffold-like protein, mitochondrial [Geosmithia morbida]
MASSTKTMMPRAASRLLSTTLECHIRPSPRFSRSSAAPMARPLSTRAGYAVSRPQAPTSLLRQQRQRQQKFLSAVGGVRSIFIQTEGTPNPDALKFIPNHQVVPESLNTPFIEYMSPRSTISPPYPSPLASKLMNIDGITSVFYGADFITVTKSADTEWAHVRPEIFALVTEAITSGEAIVNITANHDGAEHEAEEDSLAYNENDDDVVGMIKELLETRIRPAIQEDGGDIEFHGFDDGVVKLKLRGACRTCDSSTVTLKNGIESMLKHYIEEVTEVHQVMDEGEQIAIDEFAKFEEKLKQQKGAIPA